MKKIYSVLFWAFLILPLNAQWQQITGTNISGTAQYNNLVYTGNSVLLVNQAGVYRSDDNGVSWVHSVDGLDTTNLSVNDIVFIQPRNEVWIVSNGNVFKSTDYGKSWKKQDLTGISGGWPNQIGRIKNRLIVGYNYYDSGLGKNVNKLCYSDDGITWSYGAKVFEGDGWIELIHSFNDRFLGIIYDPQNGSPESFLFSTDGTDIGLFSLTGLPANYEMDADNFSSDPSGDYFFFIHNNVKKVYRFNFGTNTWEEKMDGIEFPPYSVGEIFAVQSLGGHAFASALFTDGVANIFLKLFYSSNNGEKWVVVPNPGVDFPIFEDEMISAGSNRLIGSYFNNLMAYSDNTGQTWTPINNIDAGRFDFMVGQVNGSIFTLSPNQLKGLIRTTDNGATWNPYNGDLPNFMGIYLIESIFPGGPNVMYLVGKDTPFENNVKLFKTTDYGAHWVRVTSAPSEEIIQFVGRHGSENPIVFFGNKDGQGSYKYTTDQGATWNDITGIGALSIDRVMGIKGNGSLMMLFAEKSGQIRVYKSTNNGGTFSDITSNLDAPNLQIMVADRWAWRKHPSAIASFNLTGDLFVVAVIDYWTWPNLINFYKLNTTQNGWDKIGTEGISVPYNLDCQSLRHDGSVWYFVTPVGVYASVDNCQSWLRIWNNEGYVMGLRPSSFIPNNYGVLLGTEDGGFWRAQLTLPQLTTEPVTEITETTAKSGGNITSTGGLPFLGKGLVYSTNPDPVVGTGYVLGCGSSWEDYTGVMFSLTPNTTYYVKSLATNPKGHGYGNELSFTTLNPTGIVVHKPGEVYLYPNPSNGLFNIVADADMTMTVLNVIGKVVLTAPVYNGINTYELKNQPAGIYFVKLKGEGKQEQTVRLIIK